MFRCHIAEDQKNEAVLHVGTALAGRYCESNLSCSSRASLLPSVRRLLVRPDNRRPSRFSK